MNATTPTPAPDATAPVAHTTETGIVFGPLQWRPFAKSEPVPVYFHAEMIGARPSLGGTPRYPRWGSFDRFDEEVTASLLRLDYRPGDPLQGDRTDHAAFATADALDYRGKRVPELEIRLKVWPGEEPRVYRGWARAAGYGNELSDGLRAIMDKQFIGPLERAVNSTRATLRALAIERANAYAVAEIEACRQALEEAARGVPAYT